MSTQLKDRPLVTLNRMHWDHVLKDPSASAWALNNRGCATRYTYLNDIAKFMNTMISKMCFSTQRAGKDTDRGFLLFTWKAIAEEMKAPEWRVKQCAKFASDRGWITSVQPREKDEEGNWVSLASVKSINDQYFKDLGLTQALGDAKKAAIAKACARADKANQSITFRFTPISMLRKIAKKAGMTLKTLTDDFWRTWFKQPKKE